jgi:hypothetical protein
VLDSPAITLDIDVANARNEPVRLKAVLESVTGLGSAIVDFGTVISGPYTLTKHEKVCRDRCRLAALRLSSDRIGGAAVDVTITLRGLSARDADLADAARWRATGGTVTAGGAGLRFGVTGVLTDGAWLQPVDAPFPVPVLATVPLPDRMAGMDALPVSVRTAARVTALPRLGIAGALVDLEYANRVSIDGGVARAPEVWLNAAAPPDIVARLAAQGLVVTAERDVATARARLDQQGPALALLFHLCTGALAVILAAGGLIMIAAVDRTARAADQAALRVQGLSRRTARLAVLSTYPALVLAAAVLGLAVALVVWRLTGWALPVFGPSAQLPALPLPHWPGTVALPASWLACVVLLFAVAVRAGTTRHPLLGGEKS